ncbi:HD domain-containing protein [Granulicatella adiacens]|uniref:HD domain-containing protein n=1 Tax=Granulicatella adiacens TaxID=46124 RepID=UPI00352E82E4
MKQQEQLEAMEQYVQRVLSSDTSGHDWSHIERVVNTTKTIAQEGADLFICEAAALLHDIIDDKIVKDPAVALKELKEFLTSIELTYEQIDAIESIITRISFKNHKEQQELSLEGKVVQDADRLDAIGAIGIARVMCYSGSTGRPIHRPELKPREELTPEEYRNGESTAIMHFYEKLLKLKDLMNTKYGNELAKGRHEFLETYLEQFYAEWDGKR